MEMFDKFFMMVKLTKLWRHLNFSLAFISLPYQLIHELSGHSNSLQKYELPNEVHHRSSSAHYYYS
uniref:Putative ovule protein n=1 Tax=Solanum chacoense TaxID=4108 RepID=A0A0V0I1T8_SOLCH